MGDPPSRRLIGNLVRVTPKGPIPSGGGPDDEGSGEHEDQDSHDEGAESDALKGWLPPEDRLWLHPSELPTSSGAPAGPDAGQAGTGPPGIGPAVVGSGPTAKRRRRRDFTAVIGIAGAAAAVVVGVFFLVETGMGSSPPAYLDTTATTLVLHAGCCTPVPEATRTVNEAMVTITDSAHDTVVQSCGVAVMGGGLIATTADAVPEGGSIMATTSTGKRERARLVAMDKRSDVALLRVATDLPVPRFSADNTMAANDRVTVMVLAPVTPSDPAEPSRLPGTAWATSVLRSVGQPVKAGTASGMAALDTAEVKVPALSGEVLVDPAGAVVGLLDAAAGAGAPGDEVFLPSQLVLGVATQLASAGQVHHGWLGIAGHDATGTGAFVATVSAHGPAAGVLQRGDVIVSINGAPVRSMAELRARLYVLAPGTTVQLELARAGRTLGVGVSLSSAP